MKRNSFIVSVILLILSSGVSELRAAAHAEDRELQLAIELSMQGQELQSATKNSLLEEQMIAAETYARKMQQAIDEICGQNSAVAKQVQSLGQEAYKLLEDLQIRYCNCKDAQRELNNAKVIKINKEISVIFKQLLTIKGQLIAIKKNNQPKQPVVLQQPVAVPALSPHERMMQSRDAALAHLVGAAKPGKSPRFNLDVDPSKVGCLKGIPAGLLKLPGVKIVYYPSPELSSRVPGTCGTRALGNAIAIRDAVAAGSLAPEVVFRLAGQHDDLNSHTAASVYELIDLACVLDDGVGIPLIVHSLGFIEQYKVHVVERRGSVVIAERDENITKENPFIFCASTEYLCDQLVHGVNHEEEDVFQENMVQQIRSSKNIVVSFISTIDVEKENDHGVLISIVKQDGKVPTIIYMDCNNEPIRDQSKSAAFIHYLYLQCIA